MKIGVIGAGSWGTAVANHLAENHHEVSIWARESEVVESITSQHVNTVFLPDCPLSENLTACSTVEEAVQSVDMVISAAPSHAVRAVGEKIAEALKRRRPTVVSISKGLEPKTHKSMTEVLEQTITSCDVVALSGPSFALEVYQKMPTAVVAASANTDAAGSVQQAFSNATFRVYTSPDTVGVQVGGALKNVVAIAAGISDGLGMGHNTRAALITRGLAEISRLAQAMGADGRTLFGLAGMGDLILTATGDLSRNRTVGIALGKGANLAELMASRKTVAEGVNTAQVAVELAEELGVDVPIASEVENILFRNKSPRRAMDDLMERELKSELWQ